MKNELQTLRKVEELQHDSARTNNALLYAANDASRRRAISGLDDRQRLVMLEREREARMRNSAGHMGTPMLASPAMSTLSYGHQVPLPRLNVPSSPGMLSSGLDPHVVATPRVRAVSHSNMGIGMPGSSPMMGGLASPSMGMLGAGMASPRMRTHSANMTPATADRIRLEERKRALMEREANLQMERERRLLAKKSALDLDAQEIAIRHKARELEQRAALDAHDQMLNREEALLQQRHRDQLVEHDLDARMRALNVSKLL